jgi:xanthine dehydrogenase YagR molybdenum-binding subunit
VIQATGAARKSEHADGYSSNAYGAVFVEVTVDEMLGRVRVSRMTAAYAAGRILNASTARSQYIGGLVFGIGMALHEETRIDANLGRIVNATLSDYLVPVHADVPDIDLHFVEETDEHLENGGVKGVGMLGTVGTAAAIANAVFHATGCRVRDLPIRLEDFL